MRREVAAGAVSVEQEVRVQAARDPLALELRLKQLLLLGREGHARRQPRREPQVERLAQLRVVKL